MHFSKKTVSKIVGMMLILSTFLVYSHPTTIYSATLSSGSLALSDSRPSQASTTYTLTFSNVTTSTIKCVAIQFATTATGTTKPSGMTVTSADVDATSNYVTGIDGWTVTNDNTAGTVKVTDATGGTPSSASSRTLVVTTITNPSTVDTAYYAQFSTYNNTNCSSSAVDSGTVAFILTTGQAVSATVDPSLTFTVGAVSSSTTIKTGVDTTISTTTSTIPLGTLSTSANTIGAHQLSVTTNAQNGYTVYTRYTGALSNGSHSMTNENGTNGTPDGFSSAGTEDFGYTTSDDSLGTGTAGRFGDNDVWAAFSTSNAEVMYNSGSASNDQEYLGYQAGISGTTPAGSYTNTVIVTATPTY